MAFQDTLNENPEASDYIANFYLNHAPILLESQMTRSQGMMINRKTLMQQMMVECRDIYGIVTDPFKIKSHFDNRKIKLMKSRHEHKQKELSGEKASDFIDEFDNATDRRLWEYISKQRKDTGPMDFIYTQCFQDAVKEAEDSMQLIKEEIPDGEPETGGNGDGNLLENLLRSNGVVLNGGKPKAATATCVLNKDQFHWDNFATKLVLPNDASDYVIEFFLDNQAALLDNTSSRSNVNNFERKQKMNELVTEIQQRWGIVTDVHKMKSHFDNRKSRIMRRGFEYETICKRRKGHKKSVEDMFEMELDLRLWKHFRDGPPSKKEESDTAVKTQIIEGEPISLEAIMARNSPVYEPRVSIAKRRKVEEENGYHPDQGRIISDDEYRSKQYELMEKQIKFFEENTKLLTAMTTTVSALFEKIESLPNLGN